MQGTPMTEVELVTEAPALDQWGVELVREIELSRLSTVLCDADGNLFASEEPAFDASVEVVNRLMAELGCSERYEAEQLRMASTGRTFRAVASDLAERCGARLSGEALEHWVSEEQRAVSAHLGRVLRPDEEVTAVLARLNREYRLALVSSSALHRLDVCLRSTGLSELLPPAARFSAEDSLARPTSKPDPAIYRAAVARLGLVPEEALAIEDSPTGALSAVGAGIPTIGNLCFVAHDERETRRAELKAAGVSAIVTTWTAIERLLSGRASHPGA
jgi:HAD superfamily hydrolase (TIGR01509 family)